MIENTVSGFNRTIMSFSGMSYGKYVHRKLLTKEEKQEAHDTTAYTTVDKGVIFTQMNEKSGI